MGSPKLILVALQLVLEGCSVFSQFIQGSQTFPCISSTSIIPAGQFVIPAVIKPILQPDVTVQNSAPVVSSYPGDFSGFGGFPGFPGSYSGGFPGSFPGGFPGSFPGPYGGMPPIIFDDDDDDRSCTWLYWLILALSRRGRFGGGYFGNGYGYGGGYGNYGGGGCGGGCCGGCNGGCSGGCNGGSYGCASNGFGGGYGSGFGSGFCGCNGGCACGGYGGFNGNSCGGGNGCPYFPYPIPVPCGCNSGFPNYECPCDESYTTQGSQTPQEIKFVIQTEQTPPCNCDNKSFTT